MSNPLLLDGKFLDLTNPSNCPRLAEVLERLRACNMLMHASWRHENNCCILACKRVYGTTPHRRDCTCDRCETWRVWCHCPECKYYNQEAPRA